MRAVTAVYHKKVKTSKVQFNRAARRTFPQLDGRLILSDTCIDFNEEGTVVSHSSLRLASNSTGTTMLLLGSTIFCPKH